MNLLLAATNPLSHAVPHRLHEHPLIEVPVGGGDIPALNVFGGKYGFYITNHLSMTVLTAILVVLVFWYVARRVKPSGQGLRGIQDQRSCRTAFRDDVHVHSRRSRTTKSA